MVLPCLPAPSADPSQETSPYPPCMLQVSPGRLYVSELLYLCFAIRISQRSSPGMAWGFTTESTRLAALSHQLSKWVRPAARSKFPSKQIRDPGAEQSRASGSSSLQAQLWGWGSVTCGRVLRCGRNQNSKLVT